MENIMLYPDPAAVFTNPAMAMYFKPMLTVMGESPVHLLTRDGLALKSGPADAFAENYCFGFAVEGGKYRFAGDLNAFDGAENVPGWHATLQNDWLLNRDAYLKSKTTVHEFLTTQAAWLDSESARMYARSFYSFEFTRYFYQLRGVHRHVSVVTEGWAKNEDPFLLDEADAADVLEEYLDFIEAENPVSLPGLNAEMLAAATESRRFAALSGSCIVMGLLDKDMLYMVEYHS